MPEPGHRHEADGVERAGGEQPRRLHVPFVLARAAPSALRTVPLTPQQTTTKATIRNVQTSERRDDDAESVTNLAK